VKMQFSLDFISKHVWNFWATSVTDTKRAWCGIVWCACYVAKYLLLSQSWLYSQISSVQLLSIHIPMSVELCFLQCWIMFMEVDHDVSIFWPICFD
jgi:hypothetical protein